MHTVIPFPNTKCLLLNPDKVQCDVAKKNDKASTRVVRLTWCLLWLTLGLGLIALIQTALMIWGK